MNRDQFISFLEHPLELQPKDAILLDDIIREFPYFQTGRLLYLKSLHNQNSIHYGNQLKLTAIYAGDRSVLYDLVHQKKTVPSHQTINKQGTEVLSAQSLVVEVKVPEDEKKDAFIEKEEKIPAATGVNLSVVEKEEVVAPIVEEEKKEAINPSPVAPSISENLSPVMVKQMGILEKEIIKEAINASINIEVGEEVTTSPPPSRPVLPKVAEEHPRQSFFDWLTTPGTEAPTPAEKEDERKRVADLVDKFIAEEPKISRPKANFYSPVNVAQKSVKEDRHLVTETLAGIYVKQGNIGKAISAYEVLCLKYPEKRTTFAARIEELKNKLNQHK